jgi:hypothetical protein
MASDITLAVGDGARRMTYAELAAVRGISPLSAERLVRRRHWPRQTGNDGVVRVLVPLTEARNTGGTHRVASPGHPPRTGPDIRGVIREVIREIAGAAPPDVRDDIREDDRETVRALERAIEALREQLSIANELTANTGHQLEIKQQLVEDGRKRIDELQQRVDELHTALADAVTAERIAAGEAAALRTIVTGLRARPWWRRWFRSA